MSFLTTKEGMTFRRIRHHHVYVFSDCAICHHYHFRVGMSFLTTKEGMTFRRIRHHHVYVFSDCRPAAGNMAATLKETWPCWRLGVREMSCVSLLIASIHTQYIRMSRCDVSFQTSFCDIKKFSLAMVHSS